jgi:transmembrane sensor
LEQSQHIKTLYQKYLNNNYSEQELDELLEYFYNSAEHHELSDMIKSELTNDKHDFQSQAAVKSLLAELDQELFVEIKKRRNPVKVSLWPRIAVAAAAVAAIVFWGWFFSSDKIFRDVLDDKMVVNDIAPGKNTATLTLANGKVINLSDAKTGVVVGTELKYDDGTNVNSSSLPTRGISPRGGEKRSTMLTASTPRGGTYQVVLPDGTKVWLNADSRISFPSIFMGDKRQVELEGEAYFEVSKIFLKKGGRMPFIVMSKGQKVEVLGTHFNISSYPDERSVKTTLLEGSVRVNDEVVLKPNQQSVLTEKAILVKQVDVNLAIAWTNGDFMFRSEEIGDIMKEVERWYNVVVLYQDDSLATIKFSGNISRYKNVSALLDILQTTGQVHFVIKGKQIIVTK